MTNPAYEATNSDVRLIARTKQLSSLMVERFSMNPISAKILREDWEKEFPDHESVAKRFNALIVALEQAQQEKSHLEYRLKNVQDAFLSGDERALRAERRVSELEKTLRGTEESLIAAVDQVAELDSAPNGMMQLSNELAEMKRKFVELTVWYGAMPESNGKTNWTAILHRKGECLSTGITIDRSEYADRVRYEADRMSHLIGELTEEPDILAYDANKHSGYTARKEGE